MRNVETAKWADEAVREGRKVRLIDLNSTKKHFNPVPFFITAIEDTGQRMVLVGSEPNGSETGDFKKRKEKIHEYSKGMFLRPDKSTDGQDEEVSAQVAVTHLMNLDLANDKDAAIFYLCVLCENDFAVSKLEVNPKDNRYYFEDKRRDSADKRKLITSKMDVLKRIREIKADEISAVFRLALGHKPEGLTFEDMLADLEIFSDENPKIISNLINDPKLAAKIFVMHLMNADIVKYQRYTGSYYDGDNKIGTSLDAVVDYVTAPENSKLKDVWGKKLKKSGSNVSGNVSEPVSSDAQAQ
jgi:hypothetical protein